MSYAASLAQTARRLMQRNRSTYQGSPPPPGSPALSSQLPRHPVVPDLNDERMRNMLRPTRKYGVRPKTTFDRWAARICRVLLLVFIGWLIYGCVRS